MKLKNKSKMLLFGKFFCLYLSPSLKKKKTYSFIIEFLRTRFKKTSLLKSSPFAYIYSQCRIESYTFCKFWKCQILKHLTTLWEFFKLLSVLEIFFFRIRKLIEIQLNLGKYFLSIFPTFKFLKVLGLAYIILKIW